MTYRRPIFIPGKRYRVKQDFSNGSSTFSAGEVLIFDRDGYSRYDDSFIYAFRGQKDDKTKDWWLHDNEPAETWKQYFEPIEP